MSDLGERNNEFDRSIVRRLIELRAVLSLLGNCKVFERVESRMEIDRRYLMCLIELRAVRSLLGELMGV